MEANILVVEDESQLRNMAAQHLRGDGFEVALAADGQEALHLWQAIKPDLIVLDIMLPRVSGWEVLKKIRQKDTTPIIVLTARAEEVDKLLGLELGADDYMTKPFSMRELSARIRAVLRRSHPSEQLTEIVFAALNINPDRLEAYLGDSLLSLTATEFKILLILAENPGQVFSRLQILERVFGDVYEGYERTIDTHISNLRRKMEAAASPSNVMIKTVYGIGYKLVAED